MFLYAATVEVELELSSFCTAQCEASTTEILRVRETEMRFAGGGQAYPRRLFSLEAFHLARSRIETLRL